MELALMWKRACRFIRLHLSLALVLSHLIFPHSSSLPLLFPSISFHIFPLAFPVHRRDSPEVEDNPSSGAASLSCWRKTRWRERCQLSPSTLPIPAGSEASQPPSARSFLLCLCFPHSSVFSLIMKTRCFALVNVADSTYNRKHWGSRICLC